MPNKITIFTDGSSRNNPGPGGWGAIIVSGEKVKGAKANSPIHVTELGGGEKYTTNNRMELQAAVESLKKIPARAQATLHTDSSYVINGITKWIKGWKHNSWQTKTKTDVLNKDLWQKLDELAENREIKWQYIGGHVGILGNERCDHIATAFADGRDISLYYGTLSMYDLPNILDISHDQEKMTAKKSDSARSKAKAYSYISAIGGVVEVHHTWAECEHRVKGMKGARFKKALSKDEEQQTIEEFGTF